MKPLVHSYLGLIFAATIVAACASIPDRPSSAVLNELAPTGKLRVGVATAPGRSALFVIKDSDGQPNGVTVDLGKELARRLGVPVEFFAAATTSELVNATNSGALDVTFVPVDEERKTKVDFGMSYFIMQSTYLVRPNSDIKTIAEVDNPKVRVIGIAGSATIRAAGSSLKNTTISATKSVGEAIEMIRSGKADALALTQDVLDPIAVTMPGSRVLDGAFLQTGIGIAVGKSRPIALAYANEFMENVKTSGFVQRAFDNAGLQRLAVAPQGR